MCSLEEAMLDFSVQLLRILNGLSFAGLLFIIASGFTLIFGLMRIVNMAHGILFILGAYITWEMQQQGANWVIAILVATIAVGIVSLLSYALIRYVKGDLPQTLLTLGIGTAVGDLILWIWGGLPKTINPLPIIRQPITMFEFTYPGYRYFVIVVALLIGLGLWILLNKTQLGRTIRAGVDNRAMVSALGINIDRLFRNVFVLGGVITGFAGAIGGSYLSFGPGMDLQILTFALVVVIIGGLGSIAGSAVGAIIVGLVDSFGRVYFSELAIFLLSGTLILVLAFRPHGLFGREEK
jgi:branched-chain amino acid transport system permease protein